MSSSCLVSQPKIVNSKSITEFFSLEELRNIVIVGNIMEVAPKLPNKKINTIFTSPPYFNKRTYCRKITVNGKVYAVPEFFCWEKNDCKHEWQGKIKKQHNGRGDAQKSGKYSGQKKIPDVNLVYWVCKKCRAYAGEIGHEKEPEQYIEHLASVFDILYNKLAEDGSCWINLGDSMIKGQQANIPILFSERMKKRGWVLKRTVIWYKKNAMCQSDPNNYGLDFEYLLWFTKNRNSYFHQTQYKPYAESTLKEILKDYNGKDTKDYIGTGEQPPGDLKRNAINSIRENIEFHTGIKFGGKNFDQYGNPTYSGKDWIPSTFGALKRSVWEINTRGTSFKHYASFSIEIPKIPVNANCPTHICSICGFKRKIAYKERKIPTRPGKSIIFKYRCSNCNNAIDSNGLQRLRKEKTLATTILPKENEIETRKSGVLQDQGTWLYIQKLCDMWENVLKQKINTELFFEMFSTRSDKERNIQQIIFELQSKRRKCTKLERREAELSNENETRLYKNRSEAGTSSMGKEGFHIRASIDNGKSSKESLGTLGRGSSSEWNKRQQQNTELRGSNKKDALWESSLSSLFEEFQGKIECPFCLSNNIIVETGKSGKEEDPNAGLHNSDWSKKRLMTIKTEDGFIECKCENRTWKKGIVLDPFSGIGSTGIAAMINGNDFVLIDNDPNNAEITKQNFKDFLEKDKTQKKSVLSKGKVIEEKIGLEKYLK